MSFQEYRSIPKMNASTLVHGLHSMRRMRRMIQDQPDETTPEKELGVAIHALLLEPDVFKESYCVLPDFHLDEANTTSKGVRSHSKATTYYEQKVIEFEQDNAGKAILTAAQYQNCMSAIEALRSHHSAMTYLTGRYEVTLEGVLFGEPCKGRLDVVGDGFISDLKTCSSASPHAFGRSAANLNYDFKLAFYSLLYREEYGRFPSVFVVSQETSGDFDTCVFDVPEIVIENAVDDVRRVMLQYQICRSRNIWPGVDGGAKSVPLVVPNWKMRDETTEVWDG